MSARTEKKIKQLYRRDIREKVQEMAEIHVKEGPVFNLKPKYCPLWFWNWCVKFVCHFDFLVRYQIYRQTHPEVMAKIISEQMLNEKIAETKASQE